SAARNTVFKTLFGLAGLLAHVDALPAIIKPAISTPLASFFKVFLFTFILVLNLLKLFFNRFNIHILPNCSGHRMGFNALHMRINQPVAYTGIVQNPWTIGLHLTVHLLIIWRPLLRRQFHRGLVQCVIGFGGIATQVALLRIWPIQ